jgi:hypothetical protein
MTVPESKTDKDLKYSELNCFLIDFNGMRLKYDKQAQMF